MTETLWFYSTVSSTFAGPLRLHGELNYDSARANAPIAVVMPAFSASSGNLDSVRAQARRLRDAGFFALSVAMRGRDGSSGVRDSGGVEIHDIYDAVEALKEEFPAFVDASNVHITGYSGGGGNAMSAIVRFPDYFRLASSFFGMSDYGFDLEDGWYNNGAGSRTAILDQDIGNPNTGNPVVLDRYLARASNLAAGNTHGVEIHLFVNDDETICPPVNHETFAANAGPSTIEHIGVTAAPTYQDFNGNGVEDPGERQLWPHGFPSATEQAAAEQWYVPRLLSGAIPQPRLDDEGTLFVPGFVKTRHFEVWIGDGENAAGESTYSLGETRATFTTDVLSSDPSVTMSVVVSTDFMQPAGAYVEARLDGQLIDSFPAGARRVFHEIGSGDELELALGAPVPAWPGAPWPLALCAAVMGALARRYVRP